MNEPRKAGRKKGMCEQGTGEQLKKTFRVISRFQARFLINLSAELEHFYSNKYFLSCSVGIGGIQYKNATNLLTSQSTSWLQLGYQLRTSKT